MHSNRQYTTGHKSYHPFQSSPPRHYTGMDPTMNPYALSGWYNPSNASTRDQQPWRLNFPLPVTSGALPSPQSPPTPSTKTFRFASPNHDLLNCSVVDEEGRVFFRIETLIPERTIIFKGNEPYAFIQWSGSAPASGSRVLGAGSSGAGLSRPWIQTTNHSIPKQPIGDFLPLSEDRRIRTMFVNNSQYAWVPRQQSGVYLYTAGHHQPSQLVRVNLSNPNEGETQILMLRIANEAFQLGLFEPCVVSAVLLFSNRNID